MGTIWENIDYSPNQRPTYTHYELSHLVLNKRKNTGLSVIEFAKKYNLSPLLLADIERAERSFNIRMYQTCSQILGLTLLEILHKDVDEPVILNSQKCNKDVTDTVNIANQLFHEMIMQHKIAVR